VSLIRKTYDAQALATELLPTFKGWARIDHNDDDTAATACLARTIGQLERQFGILIASQQWEWTPRDVQSPAQPANLPENRLCCCQGMPPFSWGFLPLPLRGVTDATVTRVVPPPDPPADVSDQFRITGEVNYSDFGQAYLQGLDGATVQIADVVTLATNVTADIVPPELVDVILRYALFIWENRESATDRGMTDVPDWLNRAWGPFWSPRV
jgi:hypothetical protein